MGAGASKTEGSLPNLGSGVTNFSARNTRNAAYNALNATNKALVNNVRKTYGRPNMPVQEALNLSAVPTVANANAKLVKNVKNSYGNSTMSNNEAMKLGSIPTQVSGGRRKTRKGAKGRKAKKSKKSKKGSRK